VPPRIKRLWFAVFALSPLVFRMLSYVGITCIYKRLVAHRIWELLMAFGDEYCDGPSRSRNARSSSSAMGWAQPPSQKLTDIAEELGLSRVRQLRRRAEDALRAETPANRRRT
jgi:hypothetical protein